MLSVNDQPNFTDIDDITVDEDCLPQTISWVSSYSLGPDNELQSPTFWMEEVSRSTEGNATLFSAGPTINAATGVITFTPASNANGHVTYNVYLKDDGLTERDGVDTSEVHQLIITINKVNDAPTYTLGDPIVVGEDSGLYDQTYATGITPGGGTDEDDEMLVFTLSDYDTSLFTEEITLSDTGEMIFTTKKDAHGSTDVKVSLSDGTNTVIKTFNIEILSINDPPTFDEGGNQTVLEDCKEQTVSAWATEMYEGADNESEDILTFVTQNNNNELFTEDGQPTIDEYGTLTYTPADDLFGVATVGVWLEDDGGTANGGIYYSNTVEFTITVESINDQPVFTDLKDITVAEDSGAYNEDWVAEGTIDVGPSNEGQTFQFSMTENVGEGETNGNASLFSEAPTINKDTGAISFTPAENANGYAYYTVYLQDNDGTDRGGIDTSEAHTLKITVSSIDDDPTFTLGGTVTVNEDSGDYFKENYASDITRGGGTDEASQPLTFTLTASDESLFSTQPSLTTDGDLTFSTAEDANGSSEITVELFDGTNTVEKKFTINVLSVNDQPSFTDTGDITVLEDSGSYADVWADNETRFIGPSNENQDYEYRITQVVIADDVELFSAEPAIDASTGKISFTPAENAFGSAQVTAVLADKDGTDNGGLDTSEEHIFTITVVSVNDQPTFDDNGNIIVNEDSGAYDAVWAVDGTVNVGPVNEAQDVVFTMVLDETSLVVNGNESLFEVEPLMDQATGAISFVPAENANGSIEATVTLSDLDDTDNGGKNISSVHNLIIYINSVNDAPVFTAGENISIGVGTGAYEQALWGTDISAGPMDETEQNLSFTVNADKPELFAVLPAISADGTLTFEPSATQSGTALVTVTLSDDGKTENDGVDTSEEQQFTINVISSTELVLTGTIYSGKTNEPITGAIVQLVDKDGIEMAKMTTGADGVYRFTGLTDSSDDVEILVSAVGYQDNSAITQISFATDPSGTITKDILLSKFNLNITAEPDVILGDGVSQSVITATVTDDDGKPISGVTATFNCATGSFKGGNTAVTNSNGSCSVTFISQKLTGTKEQEVPITAVVSSVEKQLYGSAVIYMRFTPGFVEGIVTDGDNGNKPVEGAVVTVYKDFEGDGEIDFTKTVTTGANGRYKIAVPRGDVEYNINITKPVTVGGVETQVTFEQNVQVGTISGSGGESTNPSQSAMGIITLQNEDGTNSCCGELVGSGLTMVIEGDGGQATVNINPDTGVFSVNNLTSGTYTLYVYYEYDDNTKIIVGTREITITDGGETNISDILIDPYGTITDSNTSKVIEGATVKLYYANTARNIANGRTPYSLVSLPSISGFPPSDNSNPQKSDSAGLYAFMVHADTDYYIVATKDGYNTYTSGTIAVGESIVNFNFAMTPVAEDEEDEDEDEEEEETVQYYDIAVHVSTDLNRTLEDGSILCTITYGNKTDQTLESATIQLGIPVGVTVEDAGGGTLFSKMTTWQLTKELRLIPEWVESEYEHKVLWQVEDLETDEVYTKTVLLHTAMLGEDEAESYQTITVQMSTSEPIEKPEDDASHKTFVVASRTNASTHQAYFENQTSEFSSSAILTRADAAVIFAAVLGLDTEDGQTAFTDVQPDDAFAGAIKAVTDAGYMNGSTNSKFYPKQGITRARFVSMIAQYLQIERSYYVEPLEYNFTDITFSWARTTIEEAYYYGIIAPYSDGTFKPNQAITRGEALVMLNRMLCLGTQTNPVSPFTDLVDDNPILGEITAAVCSTQAMTNEDGTETVVAWLENETE